MAVAGRFELAGLFNDAMDAYTEGERVLGRTWVWPAQLQVAYTRCGAASRLRRLLCDRVLYEAANGATFWRYAGSLAAYEEFLADLLARLDEVADASMAGVNAFAELENPLYRVEGVYHVRD